MGVIKSWKCLVCGAVVKGEQPPEKCPVCGVGADRFVEVEEAPVSFRSSSLEQVIIIGNGISGFSACEAVRKRNLDCPVEIITEENVVAYNRPMLTKGILEEIDTEGFFIKDYNWYKEHSIKITLDTKVESIDTVNKKLRLENGEERNFDKLIIATGAECNVPPIKGAQQNGVHTIRYLTDINQIRDLLPKVKNAVVIGGGVLGLETAWELAKAGKNLTILEASSRIMKNQLDEKASQMLCKAAEDQGLTVVENVKIDCIMGSGDCTGIQLEDGREFPAELVVISAGIKPNAEVAVTAGIAGSRWIEVDEKMQTSAAGVYACGDVASYNGVSIGIWNQGLEMGKVAGANAVGDNLRYVPIIPSNSYLGMGTALFSIGDTGRKESADYDTLEQLDEVSGVYKKFFFLDGRFCGGILMGDVSLSGKLLSSFEERTPKDVMSKLI